jgi:DnaJ-domain-containing protein 1
MSDLKDRVSRVVRSNLNELLDRVQDFEDRGGLGKVFDELDEFLDGKRRQRMNRQDELDGERGTDGSVDGDGEPNYTPPRPEDEKTIADYYANLEVKKGASLDEVKENYRRLMRKYHPDRFNDDPQMQELAKEISQELSTAYDRVKQHIKRRRR